MKPSYRRFILSFTIFFWITFSLFAQTQITETFNHTPLADVLKKLNQSYGIKFAYDNQLIQNIYITATLKSVTVPQALEKIFSETGLEAVPLNEVWIVRKSAVKEKRTGKKPLAIIHDKNSGETVPYARISVDNQPLRTDARGIIVLPTITADTVTIQISSPGYRSTTLRIARTELQVRNFDLEPIPQMPGDTTAAVTIFEIGDRTGEVIVNARNIKWLPQLNNSDALAPISLVSGIDATFENIDRLIVRHQGSDKNLITLDGFNIYHTEHFFGALSSFNVNAIKDVRIRRGTLDITQGGRTSSVIELTGKTGNEKRFSATAGIDQLATHIALEGPLGKNITYLFTARRSITDRYQSPLYFQLLKNVLSEDISIRKKLTTFASDTAPSTLKFYDLNAKISFQPSPLEILSVSSYTSDDRLKFSQHNTNRNVTESADWGNKGLGLQWSRQWNEIFSHRLNVGLSSYQLQYFHHDTLLRRRIRLRDTVLKNYDTYNRLKDFNLNLATVIKVSEYHSFETGIGYNRVNIRTNESYIQTNNQLRILDTTRVYRQSPTTRAAWIQYSLKYGIIKALNIAIRAEHYNLTQQTYLNPRFESYFTVHPQLTLKTSAGIYRQYLYKITQVGNSYRNLWVAANGNELPIVKSDKAMIGFTWRHDNSTYLDLEAYLQHTSGITIMQKTIRRSNNQLKASNKIYQITNRTIGIDCMAGKKWQHSEAWVAYSLSRTYNQSDNLNNGNEYPAIDDHLHEIKLGTIYWWRRWSLATTWIYGSPRPWDEFKFTQNLQLSTDYQKNAASLPSYHRLDAAIAYSFKINQSQFDCGLKIFNVYNHNYVLTRIFTLTDTPLIDYLQGNPFYTYEENEGMNFAFNIYLNWSF